MIYNYTVIHVCFLYLFTLLNGMFDSRERLWNKPTNDSKAAFWQLCVNDEGIPHNSNGFSTIFPNIYLLFWDSHLLRDFKWRYLPASFIYMESSVHEVWGMKQQQVTNSITFYALSWSFLVIKCYTHTNKYAYKNSHYSYVHFRGMSEAN